MDHLSERTIEQFIMDEISSEQAARIEAHLNGCDVCQEREELVRQMLHTFQSISRLVESDADMQEAHPDYAFWTEYVRGNIKTGDQVFAQEHLDECESCKREVEVLRHAALEASSSVREPSPTGPEIPAIPHSMPHWRERLRAALQMPRFKTGLRLSSAALIGAMAVLLIDRVAPGRLQPVIKPVPTSSDKVLAQQLQQLKDNDRQLQQAAKQTQVMQAALSRARRSNAANQQQLAIVNHELESWKSKAEQLATANSRPLKAGQMIATKGGQPLIAVPVDPADSRALQTHHLKLPVERLALVGQSSVVMGSQRESGVTLLRPDATYVASLRPTLVWKSVPQAREYEIHITDTKTHDEQEETIAAPLHSQAEVAWQVPVTKSLAAAKSYRWQIVAKMGEGHDPIYSTVPRGLLFRTLEEPELAEIERSRSLYANWLPLLGVLYARFGALDEAEQAFITQLKTHPDDTDTRRLLEQLRVARATSKR